MVEIVESVQPIDLPGTSSPALDHAAHFQNPGRLSVKLTVAQILSLISTTTTSASNIGYTPTSPLTATNVEAALDEAAVAIAANIVSLGNRVRADAVQTFTMAQRHQARRNIDASVRGNIWGMLLSNDPTDATNDVGFQGGECMAGEAGVEPMMLRQAGNFIKRLDAAWAAGTGNGGRMSAAAIADGTYHCFAIGNPTTGDVDYGFDVSPTAPTMPTGYVNFRRIGSIIRGSGVILPFKQLGDRFRLVTSVNDTPNTTNPGTSAITKVLNSVPNGIQVHAEICVMAANLSSNSFYVLVTAMDEADLVPSQTQKSFTVGTVANAGMEANANLVIKTDQSRQFRYRQSLSATNDWYAIRTFGWIDTRGCFGAN